MIHAWDRVRINKYLEIQELIPAQDGLNQNLLDGLLFT
jgi:hypothetical protein